MPVFVLLVLLKLLALLMTTILIVLVLSPTNWHVLPVILDITQSVVSVLFVHLRLIALPVPIIPMPLVLVTVCTLVLPATLVSLSPLVFVLRLVLRKQIAVPMIPFVLVGSSTALSATVDSTMMLMVSAKPVLPK